MLKILIINIVIIITEEVVATIIEINIFNKINNNINIINHNSNNKEKEVHLGIYI